MIQKTTLPPCTHRGGVGKTKCYCRHPELTRGDKAAFIPQSRCLSCPLIDDSGPRPQTLIQTLCLNQGEQLRQEEYQAGCCNTTKLNVLACDVHGECIKTESDWDKLRSVTSSRGEACKVKCCGKCDDFRSENVAPVSVIVTCHNYGRYLGECLQSILTQTVRPERILVVDDASKDNTAEIASQYDNVDYMRVEHRHVMKARLSGLQSVDSEYVLFVDADDRLSRDYIRCGMSLFTDYRIGVVYSDMQNFGDQFHRIRMPANVQLHDMSRHNFIHCGAIARREALEMSRALELTVDPSIVHEDWMVWREVLQQGWRAVRQSECYEYRRHNQSASTPKLKSPNYYELRGLKYETITLCVPLSGRTAIWPRLAKWLNQQQWPHDQVKLIFLDTSQDARFGRRVKRWGSQCDYRDVRYLSQQVEQPGLADEDRRNPDVRDRVRLAAARIYNLLAREVDGTFVWTVEDDVIPPLNAAELLLRGFDAKTASVAGPYPSRFHKGYVAWEEPRKIIRQRGSGYQPIKGNGFGCTMFRADIFRDAVFTARQAPYVDFDPAFYGRVENQTVKLCWDAECEHLENITRAIMTWDHWPEEWEAMPMDAYRDGFVSGQEATRWVYETMSGDAPAAIWGLSDGDVAWWCRDTLMPTLPEEYQDWLEKLAYTSGIHREDEAVLRPLFDAACRHANHWLIQHNWDIAERFTHAAFRSRGIADSLGALCYSGAAKRKVDCNAVYRLIDDDLFFSLIQSQRIAVVSEYAVELVDHLQQHGVNVECSLACPPKSQPKLETWKKFEKEILTQDWDLLLCSAGTLSAVLCDAAMQYGRKGLDIGATDKRLLRKGRYAENTE